LVGAPRKNQLFYSYGVGDSYVIENSKIIRNNCEKKTPKGEVIALTSSAEPSDFIKKVLEKFNVTSTVKMASSYKFCVIANGEFDIYAARERANEWDYAAGHAIAEHAGAVIKTLDGDPFDYGKEDYANPSILMKRAQNLND
jgi:3'(2'), 5'-bisphosphate nucleotidase